MSENITIYLVSKLHRKKLQLLLRFNYNEPVIALVKNKLPSRWSAQMKSWYVLYSEENVAKITTLFKNKAKIDTSQLSTVVHHRRVKKTLSEKRQEFLIKYRNYLVGKRYSESTIGTYSSFLADFLGFVANIPLQKINNTTIERFIESTFIKKNSSISTQRQFISAIKLFAKFYPHTQIKELVLERPKKDRRLPSVLSKEEIISIISSTKNVKHKMIIALIYSAGLRISELINLELLHFNLERHQLFIKNAKGRKDRYVVLARSLFPLLESYITSYRPKKYFIEGLRGGKYSSSSVRSFLEKSCLAAKVYKKVTPHTLRHSYATHLLENGTGIRHIQELLGHAKPETTMIYTHVAKKDLLDIESPLDSILKNIDRSPNSHKNSLYPDNLT